MRALLDFRVLYLAAQRALFPKNWKRTFIYLPLVMAVGIGLSVRNAKGVLEALLGMPSEFVRTPKYKIEGQSGARTWGKKHYRNRAGWLPYIEVGLGLYFAGTIAYAVQNENYATIPFLLLFVWGYPVYRVDVAGPSLFRTAAVWRGHSRGNPLRRHRRSRLLE